MLKAIIPSVSVRYASNGGSTIADLYDPDAMPTDLRAAHERNDEVLERIHIGLRFKNDTERLEKLFEMYAKMTAAAKPALWQKCPGRVASAAEAGRRG